MSDKVLPGRPPITLTLRRSPRARRLSLRISQLDGRVTLTLPRGLSEGAALDFAREKEDWIRRHLAQRGEDVTVAPGVSIPLCGVDHEVVQGRGRAVRTESGRLVVPGSAERAGARVAGFLKARARIELTRACQIYAARAGRSFAALTLRDTRSRWGSCSAEGRLMFSWRLAMAPRPVLDYVAAHEVAHLVELNHSPAFWDEVARIHGDYASPRRWLRRDGHLLHRYRFD